MPRSRPGHVPFFPARHADGIRPLSRSDDGTTGALREAHAGQRGFLRRLGKRRSSKPALRRSVISIPSPPRRSFPERRTSGRDSPSRNAPLPASRGRRRRIWPPGRTLSILGDIARTGTAVVGVSCLENLSEVKAACRGSSRFWEISNGMDMRRWDQVETEAAVRRAITEAGPGGGFILSENHGEIPWQVSDDVLMTIAESVAPLGTLPAEGDDIPWSVESPS